MSKSYITPDQRVDFSPAINTFNIMIPPQEIGGKYEKIVKEIKYENKLWTGRDIDRLRLSDFNVGDTLDINGIRFIKSTYQTNDGDYAMIIKTYDDDKNIYANKQFSIWANEKYSNIRENKTDYINTTFKKDIKVEIKRRWFNNYNNYYTMVLEITEVVAEYE